jgi:hypothetical protein
MGRVAVRTVLGQHRFLSTFGAARSDVIADKTLDEALRVHRVQTVCEQSSQVLVLEFFFLHHVRTVHEFVRTTIVPMRTGLP